MRQESDRGIVGVLTCMGILALFLVCVTIFACALSASIPGLWPTPVVVAPGPAVIPTAVATTVPAPTPPPLQAPGLTGVTLRTLCLQVDQSNPPIDEAYTRPLANTIRYLLTGLGIRVVEEGSCDATLHVVAAFQAHTASYLGAWGTSPCYTGADVEGEMNLAVPGNAPLTMPISGDSPAPNTTTYCPREPTGAPFEDAWSEPVLNGLVELWGYSVYLQALSSGPDQMRMAAAAGLGRSGPAAAEQAIPALVDALDDRDVMIQYAASDALGRFGTRAIPALVEALSHESYTMRGRAAEAIGGIGPDAWEAVPALISVLDDERPSVRSFAAKALGDIGPAAADAVPALIPLLRDGNENVRQAAAKGVGGIGPDAEEAVPVLAQALEDEEVLVRQAAAMALERIGPGAVEAVPALTRALEDENEFVYMAAAEALGAIGPHAEEAIPALIQALHRYSKYGGREATAEALTAITGQDFGTSTYSWEQWWEQQQ